MCIFDEPDLNDIYAAVTSKEVERLAHLAYIEPLREQAQKLSQDAWAQRHIDPQQALRLAENALRLSTECEDIASAARSLLTIGRVLIQQTKFNEAIAALEGAALHFRKNADLAGEISARSAIGEAHYRLNRYAESLGAYQYALSLCQQLPDIEESRKRRAVLLNNLGGIYRDSGRPVEAIAAHTESLRLKRTLTTDSQSCAYPLINLATLYQETGQYAEALRLFEEGIALIETDLTHPMLGIAFGNMATAYFGLGDYPKALQCNLDSLKVYRQQGDLYHEPRTLHNLSACYVKLGDEVAALQCLIDAQRLAEQVGDRIGQANALQGIAQLYTALEGFGAALDYALRSLQLFEAIGFRIGEAEALEDVGGIYRRLGNTVDALKYHLRSCALRRSLSDASGEAASLRSIGTIYHALGETGTALGYLSQSLEIATRIGLRQSEAETRLVIGQIFIEQEKPVEAMEAFQAALTLAETLRVKPLLAESHRWLSTALAGAQHTAERSHHRKAYLRLKQLIFTDKSQQRTRQLMAELEAEKLRGQAAELGIEPHAVSAVAEAVKHHVAGHDKTRSEMKGALVETVAVRITTFGRFSVSINGNELQPQDWRRKKARDVLKVLLLSHGQTVTTDQLLAALWAGASGKGAETLLMTAVSHLRHALTLYAPDTVFITTGDRSYTLDFGKDAEIDFIAFKRLMRDAQSATVSERESLYRAAAELYSGEFLREEAFEEWTSFERESLKDAYLQAMTFLSHRELTGGNLDTAVGFAQEMLGQDALCETAYEILFTALRRQEKPAELRRIYQQCQSAFRRELDAEPPNRLTQLALR